MRLIDADALKEKFKEHHDFFVNAYGGFGNMPLHDKSRVDEITNSISEVVNAPTIEERPKGKWILDSIGCYCSECKKHVDATTDYCPFCGADMKGGIK